MRFSNIGLNKLWMILCVYGVLVVKQEFLRLQSSLDRKRVRLPRFRVTQEMLSSMPLMRQGRRAFKRRFRLARLPPRPAPIASSPYILLFVGDSTMRNLFHALCFAINVQQFGNDQGVQPVALCAGRLTEQFNMASLHFNGPEASLEAELRARRDLDIVAIFAGSTVVDPDAVRRTLAFLDGEESSLGLAWHFFGRRPPDAVFFGAGLWLQWPMPFASFKHHWESYDSWLNYERDLAHSIANYSKYGNADTRFVTTTTHSQCEFQFQDDSKSVINEANAHGKSFASRDCEDWLKEGFGRNCLLDDCIAGLRSRDASILLNQRLREFLHQRGEAAVPHVGIVDAFALVDGRCEENVPGDAIHFHGLLYDELALLLETLGWTFQ
jgi:hypothetical protein